MCLQNTSRSLCGSKTLLITVTYMDKKKLPDLNEKRV